MFDLSQTISSLKLKNQELLAEKELMRTDRSSRTSESKSDGDKSDSESDTQDRVVGDRERLKELQYTISTLNSQLLTNLQEPQTPLEELTFKPPGSAEPPKLANGHGPGHSIVGPTLSNGSGKGSE